MEVSEEEQAERAKAWGQVVEHMKFVRFYAKWFRKESSAEMDDLIQEGAIGFYLAARKFLPARGVNLLTYARHRIKRNVRIAAIRSRSVVAIPLYAYRVAMQVNSGDLKADNLKPREKLVLDATLVALKGAVRDGSVGEDRYPIAQLEDQRDGPPEEYPEIGRAMEALSPRERDVIRRRFYEGQTLDAVAAGAGVKGGPISRERVRQLEERALGKMRRALGKERRAMGLTLGAS